MGTSSLGCNHHFCYANAVTENKLNLRVFNERMGGLSLFSACGIQSHGNRAPDDTGQFVLTHTGRNVTWRGVDDRCPVSRDEATITQCRDMIRSTVETNPCKLCVS